jgi:hypothetical protein
VVEVEQQLLVFPDLLLIEIAANDPPEAMLQLQQLEEHKETMEVNTKALYYPLFLIVATDEIHLPPLPPHPPLLLLNALFYHKKSSGCGQPGRY